MECDQLSTGVSSAQPVADGVSPRDWAGFIDGVIEIRLQTRHIAGAVVVAVADGGIVFRKGYGYADFQERKPIDPDRTLFSASLAPMHRRGPRIVDLCASPACVVTMIGQPWWKGLGPQLAWLAISVVVMLGGIVGFPIAAVRQRRVPQPNAAKAVRFVAWLTSVVFGASALLVAIGFSRVNDVLFDEIGVAARAGLTLAVAGAALSVVLLGLTAAAWKRGWWRVTGRIGLTIVAIGGVAFALWLYQWNLLGWND